MKISKMEACTSRRCLTRRHPDRVTVVATGKLREHFLKSGGVLAIAFGG